MNGVIALSSAATLFIVNKHRAADADKHGLNAQEANVVSAVAAGALRMPLRPAFKTPHCPRCRTRAAACAPALRSRSVRVARPCVCAVQGLLAASAFFKKDAVAAAPVAVAAPAAKGKAVAAPKPAAAKPAAAKPAAPAKPAAAAKGKAAPVAAPAKGGKADPKAAAKADPKAKKAEEAKKGKK